MRSRDRLRNRKPVRTTLRSRSPRGSRSGSIGFPGSDLTPPPAIPLAGGGDFVSEPCPRRCSGRVLSRFAIKSVLRPTNLRSRLQLAFQSQARRGKSYRLINIGVRPPRSGEGVGA